MTDLIRREDALAAAPHCSMCDWDKSISALPAVTVGADAVLEAAHKYLLEQYGASPLAHPTDRARILAALEPVAAPRRYMGQIMAECDCSRQGECEAAQKCLAVAAPITVSDAGGVTYGLPALQSGEVPASSAPTPDPAAIREAALREVLDILESYGAAGEAIADEVAALIPKGTADDR